MTDATRASQQAVSTVRIERGGARRATDALAIEAPLELRVGGAALAVTMRTPGDDPELAAGFALTEGVIDAADELERVAPCEEATEGHVVDIFLADEALERRRCAIERAGRATFLSSSCGVCGKESIDRVHQAIAPIAGDFQVSTSWLGELPERMRAAQATFEATGGLHAAALFAPPVSDPAPGPGPDPGRAPGDSGVGVGELICCFEDVGRHNAVDKAIGSQVLRRTTPIDPAVLMVSGRASFEIVQKAARAGIAMVAAVSAPSSLAVELAARCGITLVGFVRDGRMNVYAHESRIIG